MTLVSAFIRLAAELPDPGAPMFPTLCGGTVVGFGVGYICWLTALAIDRL